MSRQALQSDSEMQASTSVEQMNDEISVGAVKAVTVESEVSLVVPSSEIPVLTTSPAARRAKALEIAPIRAISSVFPPRA